MQRPRGELKPALKSDPHGAGERARPAEPPLGCRGQLGFVLRTRETLKGLKEGRGRGQSPMLEIRVDLGKDHRHTVQTSKGQQEG